MPVGQVARSCAAACLALVVLDAAPAPASSGCRATDPEVTVRTLPSGVTYDRSMTMAEIARAMKGRVLTDHGGLPIAVTLGGLQYETELGVAYVTMDNGLCGYVTRVNLTLGYEDHLVLLPSDVSQVSCVYRLIKEHEDRHVAIDRGTLRDYASQLERQLREAVAGIGPVSYLSSTPIDEELSAHVQAAVDAAVRPLQAERIRRHRALDTRREYARVSNACTGELKRIIRQHYGG